MCDACVMLQAYAGDPDVEEEKKKEKSAFSSAGKKPTVGLLPTATSLRSEAAGTWGGSGAGVAMGRGWGTVVLPLSGPQFTQTAGSLGS